ncbi:MAG TPA: replication initiator protein A [Candidatus Mediterraneibacter faecipullorum]|uniref:Replication initiator protein A n=1 Tax=Candidatus Mediterraneibacter faecipullorum TaxID=2838670 RepID=A0A9D2NL22_9FIRM|nr:replication initiator protein A [Candidatus Mediterraneibacter faecipullorum]
MLEIQFDYFRGMEAEQYSFYRVPKVLFTAECFKSLSCEAKVLYGLMLDRMSLSIKNRWFDEEDRVYIIFTVEEIMELLGCGRQKAIKNIAELDSEKGIGLIEKKRLGLGKPNVIYVKNFMIKECQETGNKEIQPEDAENTQKYENQTSRSMKSGFQEVPKSNFQKYENQTSGSMKTELQEVPESNFRKCENQTSGSMKIKTQEVPKSNCNNTDINNTDFNGTDSIQSYLSPSAGEVRPVGEDVIERMETYRALIQENIDYECFLDRREKEDVDELIELMVEILMMPDDSVVRIGGADKPVSVVKSRFLKLTYSHIEYVLFSLHRNTSKVANIRAYLLTTLYNSSMTMNHYYQAEVNHDLYGGK